MAHVVEVDVSRYDPVALQDDLPAGRWEHLRVQAREALGERTLWHVNSTAAGGGVAEMLHPVIGLARSVGLSARWLVIDAPSLFFDITKRVDNGVSGIVGDGGQLGAEEERTPYIGASRIIHVHDVSYLLFGYRTVVPSAGCESPIFWPHTVALTVRVVGVACLNSCQRSLLANRTCEIW
ncbi:hypothetical protein [Rhodococcus erythropolis]|uniref:hypothetical protein n=1 Tax=Rhodococcus erythropolis TaxID=1833 RepID=UPI0035A999D1